MEKLITVLLILVILVLVFEDQLRSYVKWVTGKEKDNMVVVERPVVVKTTKKTVFPVTHEAELHDKLYPMGPNDDYDREVSLDLHGSEDNGGFESKTWVDYVQDTELDPSIKSNHRLFVKDASRYYNGANFTSIDSDSQTVSSTNFIGLRRPKHSPIGISARQIPDIDESVLKRNRRFII